MESLVELPAPDGIPPTPAVPTPTEPALGEPTVLPAPAEDPLAAPPVLPPLAPPVLCADEMTVDTRIAIALIAAVGVSLRLTVMFPALAVEANGATPSHALADTKGHVLRILALFFLALAPWSVAALGSVLLLGRGAMITGSPRAMLSLLMGGVLQTITLSLTAIIASLVFMALGAQARRAALRHAQT